jgi:hypothetical protein
MKDIKTNGEASSTLERKSSIKLITFFYVSFYLLGSGSRDPTESNPRKRN